jgi:hypothetical protein
MAVAQEGSGFCHPAAVHSVEAAAEVADLVDLEGEALAVVVQEEVGSQHLSKLQLFV